jgi:hypothetical protein
MTELRRGRTTDQNVVVVHGAFCEIPPRNSNVQKLQYHFFCHFQMCIKYVLEIIFLCYFICKLSTVTDFQAEKEGSGVIMCATISFSTSGDNVGSRPFNLLTEFPLEPSRQNDVSLSALEFYKFHYI